MGDWENKHLPQRNRTYTAIWQAVKDGKLKRGKCAVCGSPHTQAHHVRSYSGTKGIVWLCDKHHRARHSRLRKSISKSSKFVEIIKADDERQIVYLVLAKPLMLDTDKQWFEADDIELLAHRYAVRYFLGEAAIYEEHKRKLTGVYLIESYLAPITFTLTDHNGKDRTIPEGTWIVGLWLPNEEDWAKVKSGEYAGGSVRGPAHLLPGIMPDDFSTHDISVQPVGG